MALQERFFPDATGVAPISDPGHVLIPRLSHAEEVERARAHFTSLDAYGRFDTSPDGRLMSGCMDPRPDDIPGQQQTKVMGPGGCVGEAMDHSKALSVVSKGGLFVWPEAARQEDKRHRRTIIQGGHRSNCLYVNSIRQLLGEEYDPSDLTLELVGKWNADHELGITKKQFGKIYDQAGNQLDHLISERKGIGGLLDSIDQDFPEHANVPHMVGEANPGFYIVNGFPHLGLDRHTKHVVEGLKVQAYHDNVGARLNEVHNIHSLPRDVRLYRMAALLVRSAAAVTVITTMTRQAGHPVEYLEVEIGDKGPVFTSYDLH